MALIFQDPQQRADRGITRGIRQRGADFGGGGAFLGVQNVHDLAFPPAEMLFQVHLC
jgi:hypothetical protein